MVSKEQLRAGEPQNTLSGLDSRLHETTSKSHFQKLALIMQRYYYEKKDVDKIPCTIFV